MHGEQGFDPLAAKLEAIQALADSAKISDAVARGKLNSYLGRTGLSLKTKRGKIPEWAKHHLEITKQLETAVKELNAQTKIPKDVLRNVITAKQLQKAIKKNQAVSPETLEILQQCQETSSDLAEKVNYRGLLEINKALKEDRKYLDPNRLITGEKKDIPIENYRMEWHLNLGLLMNVYNRTEDPELKRKLSFLALNYLAKAAPINIREIRAPSDVLDRLEDLFQLGLFQKMSVYHREVSTFENAVRAEVFRSIAPAASEAAPLLLTDASDISILLPTKFSLLSTTAKKDEELKETWKSELADHFITYFDKQAHSKDVFKSFLDPPVVIDLTQLAGDIQVNHEDFQRNFDRYETLMDQAITEVVQKIKGERSNLIKDGEEEKKLEAFIRANLICISLTTIKEVACVKVLPMFYNPKFFEKYCPQEQNDRNFFCLEMKNDKESYSKYKLNEFATHTGIRLGGVRAREQIFNFMDLHSLVARAPAILGGEGQIVEYEKRGSNPLYFAKKSDLLNNALFTRFENRFSVPETVPPHATVLGDSTVQLVKGLLTEIDERKWIELNADPDTRQILQTTLYRLTQHLAQAENNIENFTKFSQAIELIHSELATVLALTSPFKEEEFSQIYQENQLQFIPEELSDHVKVGVAKSAMNVFAGINAAIQEHQPDLQRAYGDGTYFEEVQFIGDNRSINEVLGNPSIGHIDLYVSEFNHNINIDIKHNVYKPGNVQGDIETILKAKPDTQQLTVAIDCTIDFNQSDKVKTLLEHFSQEIQEGKLNFIFFRSGQKFDMLGMDNYYGGLFYMVNNGDKKWKPFDALTTHEAYKTDPLSVQWFSLVNKYAPNSVDAYRRQIFENTRNVLDQIPENLKPGKNPHIKVCKVAKDMEPAFIDIKLLGKEINSKKIETLLVKTFDAHRAKIHLRGSFGFNHANLNVIPGLKSGLNIRINPGIDPKEVEILVEFLNELSKMVASL